MVYLVPLPGLIMLAVLAYEDIRTRRVSRLLIVLGICSQLLATLLYCTVFSGDFSVFLLSISGALISTLLQSTLALIKPGALGLGDVNATALATLSISIFGWLSLLFFWLFMGIIGLVSIPIYYSCRPSKKYQSQTHEKANLPFVTVIFGASLLTVIFQYLSAI